LLTVRTAPRILWTRTMHPLPPAYGWHDPTILHRLLEWLNANSPAVQAIATVILVVLTGYYAVTTHRLLKQARQSAGAAKAQADAAQRQAEAAEKTIAFIKQQYDEQLGFEPQVVLAAIASTNALIYYWKAEAAMTSPRIADPADLGDSPIRAALTHTRRLPAACEKLFIDADAALRAPKYALQKLQRAELTQHQRSEAHKAGANLETAEMLLASAKEIVERHIDTQCGRAAPSAAAL
jgi:hypothetical protein